MDRMKKGVRRLEIKDRVGGILAERDTLVKTSSRVQAGNVEGKVSFKET